MKLDNVKLFRNLVKKQYNVNEVAIIQEAPNIGAVFVKDTKSMQFGECYSVRFNLYFPEDKNIRTAKVVSYKVMQGFNRENLLGIINDFNRKNEYAKLYLIENILCAEATISFENHNVEMLYTKIYTKCTYNIIEFMTYYAKRQVGLVDTYRFKTDEQREQFYNIMLETFSNDIQDFNYIIHNGFLAIEEIYRHILKERRIKNGKN